MTSIRRQIDYRLFNMIDDVLYRDLFDKVCPELRLQLHTRFSTQLFSSLSIALQNENNQPSI